MSPISIVCGLGFGDEGKGRIVDALSNLSSLVIRFNGGSQAAHNVSDGSRNHIFSHIGSGTIRGADTYWSQHCTVCPVSFLYEYGELIKTFPGIITRVYVDGRCPVITPFDIFISKRDYMYDGTTTCGVGSTIERHETLNHSYRIFANDLKYPWILEQKIDQFKKFFNFNKSIEDDINVFLESAEAFVDLHIVEIVSPDTINDLLKYNYSNLVFEGAQGILLDRNHGIFPHVTRSNTTTKNAMKIIREYDLVDDSEIIDIFYVSRCYQTRHGNGPLYGEKLFDRNLISNPNETNLDTGPQGKFRYSFYSPELIEYAKSCDALYHNNFDVRMCNVMTCFDQVEEIPIIYNGSVSTEKKDKFIQKNNIHVVSDSACGPLQWI